MLDNQTLDKLREMRLTGMLEAYVAQCQQPDIASLSFEERFGLLVDHEATYRKNRRLARLLGEAKLRLEACVEDIRYHGGRGLERGLMQTLSACDWIDQGRRVLITGPTGAGKTYIACALGHAACRRGYRTRYFRLSRFLETITLARADGSYPRLLGRLAKTDLLILDDWGLAPLSAHEAREILEVLDDRTDRRATVIASQVPADAWHGLLGDPTVADAILDRLVHGSFRLNLRGESMRKTLQDEPHEPTEDGDEATAS